jgi:DNA invertase Pin-like site-specific DNA recombinase
MAGHARARADGKRWGGSEKGRRLKVTDEQLAVIKQMRKDGASISAISRATSLTRPTIYSHLPT